jgi:flagellar protein FlgJ
MPRLTKLQAALDRGQPVLASDDEQSRVQAARDLASLFIYQLLKEMRKTIPKSGLFDGGRAQEIYEQMIDERLADMIAGTPQLGLAKLIENELARIG